MTAVAQRRLRGRPELYTSYAADMALLNTPAKRLGVAALGLGALALAVLLTDDILVVLATACALAIGAIGLNLVTGYAGRCRSATRSSRASARTRRPC